ncbi:hypothetical protein OIO90_006054 [Microbotryomycetes sp. JL221]|nr:hypothetical protein OIO90_006054 [Microbotryomycetes sp. JL221]
MSTSTIHSISVPRHFLSTNQQQHDAVVLYEIKTIISPQMTTHINCHRFNDFLQLEKDLCQSLGQTKSPGFHHLPSKQIWSSLKTWLPLCSAQSDDEFIPIQHDDNNTPQVKQIKGLNQQDLIQRRFQLETYLKKLITDKDVRWSNCQPLKTFLLSRSVQDDDDEEEETHDWTKQGWINKTKQVEQDVQKLKTLLNERDQLVLNKSTQIHKLNQTIKQQLVELINSTDVLNQGLKQLIQKGLIEIEIERNSKSLENLQNQIQQLGQRVNNNQRNGTLSQPTRVLGTLSSSSSSSQPLAIETQQTRPLDNQGLLQFEQEQIMNQDSKLELLTTTLRKQRLLGQLINQELQEQDEMLNSIEQSTNKLDKDLRNASKQIKKL